MEKEKMDKKNLALMKVIRVYAFIALVHECWRKSNSEFGNKDTRKRNSSSSDEEKVFFYIREWVTSHLIYSPVKSQEKDKPCHEQPFTTTVSILERKREH